MVDIVNSEPIQKVPSERTWKVLLPEASIGNSLFPQGWFAQGILLAPTMVSRAREEGIPVATLLKYDPPTSLIDSYFGRARENRHGAHGIDVPTHEGALSILWKGDKQHAEAALTQLGRMVYEYKTNPDSALFKGTRIYKLPEISPDVLLGAVQDDPLFHGLLTAAADGLKSPPVREISHEYIGIIEAFMRGHTREDYTRIPQDQYFNEHVAFEASLYQHLRKATAMIRDHMRDTMRLQYPEAGLLTDTLAQTDPNDIFGIFYEKGQFSRPEICIGVPDPFRRYYQEQKELEYEMGK